MYKMYILSEPRVGRPIEQPEPSIGILVNCGINGWRSLGPHLTLSLDSLLHFKKYPEINVLAFRYI